MYLKLFVIFLILKSSLVAAAATCRDIQPPTLPILIIYTGGTIGSAGKPLSPLPLNSFQHLLTTFTNSKGQQLFDGENIHYQCTNHDDNHSDNILFYLLSQYFPSLRWYVPTQYHMSNQISYKIIGTNKILDSYNIQPSDWVDIATLINNNYDQYSGFIVLHGTDTMAFTSAALSYLLPNINKPIIVTGSMKPLSECDRDGTKCDAMSNLLNSSILAASKKIFSSTLYTYGKLIRGTRATKSYTSEYKAFTHPNAPALAVNTHPENIHNISLSIDTKYIIPSTNVQFDQKNTRKFKYY